jgi:hypothetical protein
MPRSGLGLAIRFHWFTPNETLSAMTVFANGYVMAVAAALGLIEFLADKIPWVDSAWDSVHTFIRPLAAVAMGLAAPGRYQPSRQDRDCPAVRWRGIDRAPAKAATRFAANHSPDPTPTGY